MGAEETPLGEGISSGFGVVDTVSVEEEDPELVPDPVTTDGGGLCGGSPGFSSWDNVVEELCGGAGTVCSLELGSFELGGERT